MFVHMILYDALQSDHQDLQTNQIAGFQGQVAAKDLQTPAWFRTLSPSWGRSSGKLGETHDNVQP